jgi:murein DD-endopeptidase MepM/ murein hydrolase activator NlpD
MTEAQKRDAHKECCWFCKSYDIPNLFDENNDSLWRLPVAQQHVVTRTAENHIRAKNICGIDFVSYSTWDVFAMSAGIVRHVFSSEYNEAYRFGGDAWSTLGRFVVIEHRVGKDIPVWVRYCHMESISAAVGQRVYVGDRIGQYGYTGWCEPKDENGRHIHMDMWVDAKDVGGAALSGLIRRPGMFYRPTWGGAPCRYNVDPTDMLKATGWLS